MVISDLFIFLIGIIGVGIVAAAVVAVGLQEQADVRERNKGN